MSSTDVKLKIEIHSYVGNSWQLKGAKYWWKQKHEWLSQTWGERMQTEKSTWWYIQGNSRTDETNQTRGWRRGRSLQTAHGTFLGKGKCSSLTSVAVTWVYTFVKVINLYTHVWIVCKLHLKEFVYKKEIVPFCYSVNILQSRQASFPQLKNSNCNNTSPWGISGIV